MQHLISKIAIAPMIDWTYTHFRVFMRLLAPRALLYTDMQTIGAILHQPERVLHFHPSETPLALQVGGSDPKQLTMIAEKAQQRGFQEINLNLGCPSDRVQAGRFGACLMQEPGVVTDCIRALKSATTLPVTAKVRIGIDEHDSYEFFEQFAYQLVDAGVDKLIVHARKAWLKGLSPKQNRTIPPLHYDRVYRLKQVLPHMPIVINGNIQSLPDIQEHLKHVDGVMLGRLACDNPYALSHIHHAFYPEFPVITRAALIAQYATYIQELSHPTPLSLLLKPLFSVQHGQPNARAWKKQLLHLQQTATLDTLPSLLKDSLSLPISKHLSLEDIKAYSDRGGIPGQS